MRMVEPRPSANGASEWLEAFSSALASGEIERASSLFGEECFWRDLVAFTWNVKTLEGRDEIAAMLAPSLQPQAQRPGTSTASRHSRTG
jgi:putative flavoprotein involved in K+ transport